MLEMVKQSFRQGKKRPVVYAATGWGKTVLAAWIIEGALSKLNRVYFVVPLNALINQTAESMMNQGLPQPGIIQADNPLTNIDLPFQVCSVHTLVRRDIPPADLYIIDECDLLYTYVKDLITNTDKPVIGLTATPYKKGLGKYYNNLLSSITVEQLMEQGFLCDYKAWAPCEPDMKGVRTNSEGDYQEKGAAERMTTPEITGSITDTWLKLGNSEPTLCFAVNIAHANHIGNEFDKLGVSNKVITKDTPMEPAAGERYSEREQAFMDFSARKVTILISVMILTAGFDRPVFNLILARPIKSDRVFMQIFGRGLRVNDGKEYLRVFDHGGNFERLGYPENIHIYELNDGKEKGAANSVPETEEREEKKPKKCPKCDTMKDAGVRECPDCGFTPRFSQDVEVIAGELKQIKGKPKKADKQAFWNEVMGYKQAMIFEGKLYSPKYYAHIYRRMFGVWPRGLSDDFSCEPSESTMGLINAGKREHAEKMRAANK